MNSDMNTRTARSSRADGLSRREALKLGAAGIAAFPLSRIQPFPLQGRFGRITAQQVDVHLRPDYGSKIVDRLYRDEVVPWIRETVGPRPMRMNQRWLETPRGYIWCGNVQPVENKPNQALTSLPETSMGPGMWAEVTVPLADLTLVNPPPRSPWLKENANPRVYYGQVLWVDGIETREDDQVVYRINERFGYGDIFTAPAEAFRPLRAEDVAPIHPDVEDKLVLIDLTTQSLSCFEGKTEVFYCRISSGAKFNAAGEAVEEWATPLGGHPIWRKIISLHMSGGTTGGGYDLPGIGWTSLFVGDGVAIHATFWHNNFGVPMSHGCVNSRPQDAKWVFRWTSPIVPLDPGDITVSMPGGTRVRVVES